MLYLGLLSGLAVGNVVAKALGLPSGRIYLATVLLLIPALVGARLASVLGHRRAYAADPRRIWSRRDGGQAMYGGLVAVPLSIPLLAALGVPFWAFWDVATFTMLVGMVFARAGCLLTGCCSGRVTAGWFGIELTDHRGVRARRIPTQLLEGAFAALLLLLAAVVVASEVPAGSTFSLVIGVYAVGRLALQPLRDEQSRLGRFAALSVASASLLALSIASLLIRLA
jgi:phosphatidylglycerol:prolipoprotein diacylglycerol transferase